DLFTNPVFVDDLAWALLSALRRRDEGIVHIGGVEWVSRHEFLSQAFRIAGFPEERLIPLPAEELYRGRALRPRRAGLVITRAKELWTFSPHSLEEALLLALCRNHRGGKVSGETIE
ncbi:MAG: sugar nucleotide-binding protein, partial [Candidatus Kapabacteria bacterium]|nr:sugar nucleotide-binding protein [Candidatus Kapabacteria bacterium]MDW7996773.1 sugar nucleotide-binding protein [Bacteroidota bacterium]